MPRRVGLRIIPNMQGRRKVVELLSPELEHGGYYDNLEPFDPAWVYDKIVGSIWNQETGAYDSHYRIQVLPPENYHGGYYDKRE